MRASSESTQARIVLFIAWFLCTTALWPLVINTCSSCQLSVHQQMLDSRSKYLHFASCWVYNSVANNWMEHLKWILSSPSTANPCKDLMKMIIALAIHELIKSHHTSTSAMKAADILF
jgi:hypothetical protein